MQFNKTWTGVKRGDIGSRGSGGMRHLVRSFVLNVTLWAVH